MYLAINSLSAGQSRFVGVTSPGLASISVGVTFHMSYCSIPLLAGDPWYDSYGPCLPASSADACDEGKRNISQHILKNIKVFSLISEAAKLPGD